MDREEEGEARARIEAFAMRLATRSYLHKAFHVAFGAEPDAEVVRMLGSKDTACALARLGAVEEAARVRIEEGSPEGGARSLPACEALDQAARRLAALSDKAEDACAVEALASEYTRLFLVPGDGYVYPWESPYVGQETMLFQESTLDVSARYRANGLAARAGQGRFPEDHIAMMLDFMAHLSARAFDAFRDGDDDAALAALTSQRDFSDAHLRAWVPDFAEAVRKKDDGGAYAELARALALFVEIDGLFLEQAEARYRQACA